ncbi:MFS transporter [Aeromonas sp. QDB14]|uniref:MFS transporter n=1 Tax=Aeromonas sp. QDB14 TaxID=2989836 RepID=UPI0022E06797|nr:MFS transporter [Aeromonas sp. QDB14]
MSTPLLVSPPVTRRLGLAGLGLATLLPMLAGSMANLVLPALGQDFGVPFASLQWVLVAYLLGITSLTVVAGRLGDRLGRRRVLLWGTGVFALASLLCALAPSIGWLIAARTLQGAGAACMLVLSLAMAGELVPPARRGWSMGLLGTLSACGTALGPSFGGLLIGGFGWQAPFLLLLPLALLGAPRQRGGIIASALVASVMVATLLIGPFYLHGAFALDMGTVGLMISMGPLLAALSGMPAGWLVDRVGATPVVRLGLGLMVVAAVLLALLDRALGPLGYLLPILLLTAGYALFQTANNSAVVGEAEGASRGAVAGLLTLSRNLGQLTGAAGLGGLFAALAGRPDLALATADELAFATRVTFALTALLLMSALWLAGREERAVQGDVARDGCESGER